MTLVRRDLSITDRRNVGDYHGLVAPVSRTDAKADAELSALESAVAAALELDDSAPADPEERATLILELSAGLRADFRSARAAAEEAAGAQPVLGADARMARAREAMEAVQTSEGENE